ncbi:MAG: aminodeoxychorismate/anthranilate synthase component II [Chthonomonas sp.]|nr:aminodeoxychorismate/anthranilate synthase component II [Chthonomonas sp.]
MILVIDNFDSFTYNLVQYLGMAGAEVVVRRNNELSLDQIRAMRPAGIMLSPGPCTPNESGVCQDVASAMLAGDKDLAMPLFGVCLGHQVLGQVSGGTVARAERIMHGKTSQIEHDGAGLFAGVPSPFTAVRYHSLVIRAETLHPDFLISARSLDDGEIMGIRHRHLPIEGVQFHPESVLTEHGMDLVRNFLRMVG